MIVKSLLFIIICIFIYESFQIMNKMTEEYFTSLEHNNQERFVSLSSNAEENDIAKTIAINCKEYPNKANAIMLYKPETNESLDTPYYAQFKPLEYNPKRRYYYRSDILGPEGKRRSKDDETEK